MEWAGITIVVFFVMLRATFSALSLTMKLPNPRKNTSSPAIIVSFMFLINASTTASAAVFSTPGLMCDQATNSAFVISVLVLCEFLCDNDIVFSMRCGMRFRSLTVALIVAFAESSEQNPHDAAE